MLKGKPKVGVFYDSSNIYKAQNKVGWKVSIEKLQSALAKVFQLEFIYYYNALPDKSDVAYNGVISFMQHIEPFVTFKSKPLKYIHFWQKGEKRVEKKGDMDVNIALDVTEKVSDLDVVLIVSGDSDLLPVREYVLRHSKKVAFVSFKHNMAWELTKGGKYLYFDNFMHELALDDDQGVKTNSEQELGVTLTSLLYTNA